MAFMILLKQLSIMKKKKDFQEGKLLEKSQLRGEAATPAEGDKFLSQEGELEPSKKL